MTSLKKRKITVLAGVILCVIAGCLVKRMTAVYTQKENPIGPERGTTDVFLTAADFISEKSDQELLQEIETFDTCGVRVKTDEGATITALFTHTTQRNDNPQMRIDCPLRSRARIIRRRWTKFSRPFTEKKFPARSQNRYST